MYAKNNSLEDMQKNAYREFVKSLNKTDKEFVKSLNKTDKEFVEEMLEGLKEQTK